MLKKGEPILIEQVEDGGFIVSPNEVIGAGERGDVHVFEDIKGLKGFIDKHFGKEKEGER